MVTASVPGRGAACRPSAVRPGHRVPSPVVTIATMSRWSPWCALLVVALVALDLPGCGRSSTPRNVLVVTLDTLRADRLGSYGYKEARTPVLDALAARGARFAAATTTTPLTLSAHTSLFTGTWPTTHGVRDNTGFYVPDSVQTLAETLKSARLPHRRIRRRLRARSALGHRARASTPTSTSSTCPRTPGRASTPSSGRAARSSTGARLARRSRTSQPFFAWVHLYDPHSPYAAPAEFGSPLPGHPRRRLRRRSRLHRRPGRPAAGGPRRRRPARRHAGRRPGRSRRAARRAPRAVARLLRLRRVGAGSADRRRARHRRRGSCPIRCASST